MTTRTINKSLIRTLVKEKGIALVAVEANCSPSLVQKLMSDGYEVIPTIAKIDGICFSLKRDIDELFPVFEAEKESA